MPKNNDELAVNRVTTGTYDDPPGSVYVARRHEGAAPREPIKNKTARKSLALMSNQNASAIATKYGIPTSAVNALVSGLGLNLDAIDDLLSRKEAAAKKVERERFASILPAFRDPNATKELRANLEATVSRLAKQFDSALLSEKYTGIGIKIQAMWNPATETVSVTFGPVRTLKQGATDDEPVETEADA